MCFNLVYLQNCFCFTYIFWLGSGKHAKVWRGSLGGIPVAVKALPASRITLWARERDLYSLPHMRHPNLLQYFGTMLIFIILSQFGIFLLIDF